LALVTKNIPTFLDSYYSSLLSELEREYEIAVEARRKSNSPTDSVECIFADSMEERVELLVGPAGVADRIRNIRSKLTGEQVAFKLAEEIVYSSLGKLDDETIIKQAICSALAVLTPPCITAAPSEGISSVRIKKNPDGSSYLAVYFAGPIRAAGGTELAAVVVIADYVRKLFGLDRYKPSDDEVKRFIEELRTYVRRVMRFQYSVPDRLLEYAYRMTPIEITGIPTDKILAPSYRNLPRVETNYLRGGALRVVNDGIVGRAKKVLKLVQSMGISGWDWIEDIVREADSIAKESNGEESDQFAEVIGGRPVFSVATHFGGFRIRYGRGYGTGMSALGVHPMTMKVLKGYIVLGTQLKTDFPGKGGVVVPVDVEPPVVLTQDGEVVRVDSDEKYRHVAGRIDRILFLGDILISAGDCIENNVELRRPGYCEEWWASELNYRLTTMGLAEASAKTSIPAARLLRLAAEHAAAKPTWGEALATAKSLDIPLHPSYTLFWENISLEQFNMLRRWLQQSANNPSAARQASTDIHEVLIALLAEHKYSDGVVMLDEKVRRILETCTGAANDADIKGVSTVFEAIERLSGLKVKPKAGSSITARMGRPEKAGPRIMQIPVNVLFPVEFAGGQGRDMVTASKTNEAVVVELVTRRCTRFGHPTWKEFCPQCGAETQIVGRCLNCSTESEYRENALCPKCGGRVVYFQKQVVDVKSELEAAIRHLGLELPTRLVGVRGLSSLAKQPESLVKGVLRAKHKLYVYKDGTTRFDATNAPLTHFSPRQIGTSVDRLRELGYTHDMHGLPLLSDNQTCELRIQDLVVSRETAKYLLRVSKFVDDYLKALGMKPYYNLDSPGDLVGQLVVALSPHTYVGVMGRVIGLVDGEVNYAHPIFHAAKRRDCDGDEDSIMLLLDTLTNFSRIYVPGRSGGRMDSPLLITRVIYPEEVDEQAHNLDICGPYPLAFYEAASEGAKASEIAGFIETVRSRLRGGERFGGFRFTHTHSSLSSHGISSAYKQLESMLDKVTSQLELTDKLQSVRTSAVAERIVASHILPDIIGNVRAFFIQSFRCKRCGSRYRRLTLNGKCPRCQQDLVQTVYRGAVEKYLELARDLASRYVREQYLKARTTSTLENVADIFTFTKKAGYEKGAEKQVSLEWFM